MGYHPKAIPDHPEPSYIPDINKRLRVLTEARKEATAAHELARAHMTKWNKSKYVPFKEGEKVWLEAKNIKTNRITKKLAPKREGPFTITKVLSPVTFRLELPEQWKIHDVFHASLLTPYRENKVHGPNFLTPPPDIINDKEEWEVENIIKHRWIGPKRKRQVEYLIAWKGYPSSENRWEKEELLKNAPDILQNYHITNPEAVAAAVTQIHDWIRKSPANRDQILTHFAVLHAQGDPLRIAAFTLLTSGEIMDNLRGGSSNLSCAVDAMHQAVQYLNQAAEDNLATMMLLTYPLARSGIHIHKNRLVCPLHDQPHLPAAGPRPDPPQSPPPPPTLPLEVATVAPTSGDAPEEPPADTRPASTFSFATPAIVQRPSTSRSSTSASGVTGNASTSSTDGEFTPTAHDESFVDNARPSDNNRPRHHHGHLHSQNIIGEPPATTPASTSTTTKPPGGATARQTSGTPALKDYPEPPGYSETAGPEDSELERRSSESSGGVVLRR
ncbi:hypothetical protein AX16_009768 [Volvariella volvacea WC 439]|nr:hypothetical protein AX16_009768 [Volvariella volvacea WC 439]